MGGSRDIGNGFVRELISSLLSDCWLLIAASYQPALNLYMS